MDTYSKKYIARDCDGPAQGRTVKGPTLCRTGLLYCASHRDCWCLVMEVGKSSDTALSELAEL